MTDKLYVMQHQCKNLLSGGWGMHAFQSSMPRIKDRMVFEERGERNVTLSLMILLYNFGQTWLGLINLLVSMLHHLRMMQIVTLCLD